MTYLVDAIPQRGDIPLPTSDPSQPTDSIKADRPASRYVAAYRQRVLEYNQDIAQLSGVLSADASIAASQYPTVEVTLDPEVGSEEIAIDPDLYRTFFEIYLIYGWRAIASIETEVKNKVPSDGEPSGGIDPSVIWTKAYAFVQFTRNILGLLITDALTQVELRAAQQIILNLSLVSIEISNTVNNYQFVEQFGQTGEEPALMFLPNNSAASSALFEAMKPTVAARADFEKTQEDLAKVHEEIVKNIALAHAASLEELGSLLTTPLTLDEYEKKIQELMSDENALLRLSEKTQDLLSAIQNSLYAVDRMSVLILDKLKPGFDQPGMERIYGETLKQFFQQIDELGAGVDPNKSMVALTVGGFAPDAPVTAEAITKWVCPPAGPELAVLSAAQAPGDAQTSFLPLLHADTLEMLVANGAINTDSFQYVVAIRYASQLRTSLEQQQAQAQASAKFWAWFAKAAAALALAALVTPASAAAAPVLEGASEIATLVGLAHVVDSVSEQLATVDAALKQSLIDAGGFGFQQLARLGKLGAYRDRILQSVTDEVAQQLLLWAAGKLWPVVSELLVARAYLTDVQTLLGIGEPSASGGTQ